MLDLLTGLDRSLFILLNHDLRHDWLDWGIPFLAGSKWVLVPGFVLAAWLLYKGGSKTRFAILLILVAVAVGDAVNTNLLKPFFQRPRPFSSLEQIFVFKGQVWTTATAWFKDQKTLSFPSNHAVNTVAAATVLIRYHRRWWPFWLGLALLVCYSRVYMGVHYPGDVAAGALVGMGISGWVIVLTEWISRRFPGRFSWLNTEAYS